MHGELTGYRLKICPQNLASTVIENVDSQAEVRSSCAYELLRQPTLTSVDPTIPAFQVHWQAKVAVKKETHRRSILGWD